LTISEISLLQRYGCWLEALAAGRIAPITKRQAEFLSVHHGTALPRTKFELIWFKYQVQRIYDLARSTEARLERQGDIEYWQVHELYRKAAFFGHAGSISWLAAQGDAGPALKPLDGIDLALPEVRPLVANTASTGGSGRATPAQESDQIDWGVSSDDLDSADWERHLSGPDDSFFEP
jgi:hypothetical protein